MAHPQKLKSWILSAAASKSIRVEQGTWISEFFPTFADISATTNINGEEIAGSAFGENEDLALTKAIAEMLERAIIREHAFPNSNGTAAHITAEAAAIHATQELQERDLFLCHFLTRTPFAAISQPGRKTHMFTQWLQHHKVKLSLYELGSTGALCLIDGRSAAKPFGFIISTSLNETRDEATLSTVLSAGRRAHRILTQNQPLQSLTLNEFSKIDRPNFQHHGQLALNIDYANSIAYLFANGSPAGAQPQVNPEIETLMSKKPLLADCPLVVTRATSPDVQNLFIGAPTPEKVNLQRLSSFAGRPLNHEALNPLPHPFD